MDTMISPDSPLFAPFKIIPPSFPSVSKVTMGSLGAFSSRSSVDSSPLWQAKTSCRSNGSSLGQYDRKTSTTPGTIWNDDSLVGGFKGFSPENHGLIGNNTRILMEY